MLTSNVITAEDAARYDGDDDAPVIAVAQGRADTYAALRVQAANRKWLPVGPGQWVVLFGWVEDQDGVLVPDLGVMDDGEYERWFGKP